MNPVLLVFLGGGAGAVARYMIGVGWGRSVGLAHPWMATMSINVLGGLLMGVLVGVLALRGGADQERWRLLLGVGVLGGFTTFSTFSLEAVMMLQRRDYLTLAFYAVGSVLFSAAAMLAGLYITRKVL